MTRKDMIREYKHLSMKDIEETFQDILDTPPPETFYWDKSVIDFLMRDTEFKEHLINVSKHFSKTPNIPLSLLESLKD